jgi:hypothetical protein
MNEGQGSKQIRIIQAELELAGLVVAKALVAVEDSLHAIDRYLERHGGELEVRG